MVNERSGQARRAFLAGSAGIGLVALLVISFAGAGTRSAPRDLPIAVTGGEAAATAVAGRLDAGLPGGFRVVPVVDRAAGAELVADREVYGVLVTEGQGVSEVLVASAASPAVSGLLAGLATEVGAAEVTDLVPAPADDPRGAGLAGGALPITIGGVLTGTVTALLLLRRRDRLAGVAAMALGIGSVIVAVLHGVYGALAGNVALEVLAVSAGVGAIGLVLVGLHSAVGRAGLVAADLVLILVGNPFSAATAAPELLPEPWSGVGHWMPLGATVDLLRGLSGFDGSGTAAPWVALLLWSTFGAALLLLPTGLRRSAGSRG